MLSSYQNNPNSIKANTFQLNELRLYTNLKEDDQWIDLKNNISSLTIKESILSNGITADIGIRDGRSLLEAFKITGNEKIELHISRHEITGNTKEYKLELYIAEINQYSRTQAGSQNYTLKCISLHLYNNQFITIVKPFSGSYGKTIENICKSDLKIPSDKLDISTFTGNGKGIFPRLKPLYAIQWLLKNCTDEGTPFFFYETIQGKVKLKSYKELLDQDVYAEYNNLPFTDNDITKNDDAVGAFNEELRKIRSLSSDFNISKYKSGSEGVYGSQLFNFDISTKQSEKISYKFKENKQKQLNDNKSYSTNVEFLGRKIDQITEGKNYFVSQNSLAFDDEKNYHNSFGQNSLESASRLFNLNALTKDLTIAGDFDLELGSILDLNIQRVGADPNEEARDQYLSGKYLLTGKIHTFTGEGYFMKIKVKKDSFLESADEILKIKRENT